MLGMISRFAFSSGPYSRDSCIDFAPRKPIVKKYLLEPSATEPRLKQAACRQSEFSNLLRRHSRWPTPVPTRGTWLVLAISRDGLAADLAPFLQTIFLAATNGPQDRYCRLPLTCPQRLYGSVVTHYAANFGLVKMIALMSVKNATRCASSIGASPGCAL
jgi:hypothetical protein